MKLTGKQLKQIHSALLDGYSPDSLRRLVRIHLDENLHNITSGSNFSDQVFTLIEWAEQQGRVVELVRAAHEENPNNVALQTLWQDLQSWLDTPRTLRQAQGAESAAVSEPAELTEKPAPPQIFLSYSRTDSAVMRQLRVAIEAAGLNVWTDEGLQPGTPSWQQAIESAIRVAKAMVVMLSPAAKGSQWVNIEVGFALRLGRRVFPVVIAGEDTDAVPITLFTTQFVDGRSELDRVVNAKLLPALRTYLGIKSAVADEQASAASAAKPAATVGSPTHPMPAALVTTLRTALVDLYLDEGSTRRVVADAGLDAGRIIFSGQAGNTWHSIMQEAVKSTKLADLLAVALREYGENQPLQAAVAAFQAWNKTQAGAEPSVLAESPAPQDAPQPTAAVPQPAPPTASKPRRRTSKASQQSVSDTAQASPTPAQSEPAQPKIAFDWVTIPAGEFWLGSHKAADKPANKPGLLDRLFGTATPAAPTTPLAPTPVDPQAIDDETPQHQVHLPTYRIARTPVTNAQYKEFVAATGCQTPKHWSNGQIPIGQEQHPVVYVNWQDALAFCQWVSAATGETIRLPSEAEWEKAARGPDGRIWPWGNNAPTDKLCNFYRKVGDTTPVDRYPEGKSFYGCLDMAGNVWEWTSTLFKGYPYKSDDGREDLKASDSRVLRGGSWFVVDPGVRCAYRNWFNLNVRDNDVGFRVVSSGG